MTKKEWLVAAILTFVTVFAWVVFNTIHARAQVQIPSKLQQIIEPINPNFNTKSLQSTP